MKKSGPHKKSGDRGKIRKLPRAAFVWGIVSSVLILILFILFAVTGSGKSDTAPLLLIYDRTERYFAVADPALQNTMHSCGFEYRIVRSSSNEIPSDIVGRDVVIMGIGEDSFALMRDINEDELGTANKGDNEVTGYILVDPSYPGNLSVERYDYSNPSCPVAFYGFGKKASGTDTMSDTRRLFERMSGVDTVYGAYASRGAVMSSRVYFSADQNRYLSLYDNVGYTVLLNSPQFQSDLASYLASTYGTKLQAGRLNSWFILTSSVPVFALAALFMFLFFIPVPERKGISLEKVGDDGMAAIVNMGLAVWFGVLIVAGGIIPYTVRYVKYIIYLSPLFMMCVMVLMRAGFMLTNKIRYKRSKQGALRTLAASMAISGYIIASWLLLTGGKGNGTRSFIVWGSAAVDVIIVTMLGYTDKKSRSAGENGCSYFGNIFYPLELLIPAGTAVVISFFGLGGLETAVRGLLIVIIPFICSNVIKRISDNVLFAGIVHGLALALLLL